MFLLNSQIGLIYLHFHDLQRPLPMYNIAPPYTIYYISHLFCVFTLSLRHVHKSSYSEQVFQILNRHDKKFKSCCLIFFQAELPGLRFIFSPVPVTT